MCVLKFLIKKMSVMTTNIDNLRIPFIHSNYGLISKRGSIAASSMTNGTDDDDDEYTIPEDGPSNGKIQYSSQKSPPRSHTEIAMPSSKVCKEECFGQSARGSLEPLS